MKNQGCRAVWLGGAVAAIALSSSARADWPMARHDPQRTGATTGISNVTAPAIYWRMYLGGTIGSLAALPVDVEGDGVLEWAFVVGGKVVIKRTDDTTVWQTAPIGVFMLAGTADLDGDGAMEIVAQSKNQVVVLRASTGELAWLEPDSDMGTVGGIRIADLTGDGNPEIVVHECGCCAINNGKSGFAYSFATGLATPTQLWTLPSVTCGGYLALTIVELDAAGTMGVLHGSDAQLSLLDGVSGDVIAETGSIGPGMALSQCLPIDLDGAPGDELVCALSRIDIAAGTGHRIFALRHDAPTASLELMWSKNVGELDGRLSVAPGFVADLDGDGAFEVVATGEAAGGQPTTNIFDAEDGELLGSIPAERLAGTLALESKQSSVVLTHGSSSLSAWLFDRDAMPSVSQRWTLADRRVLVDKDGALAGRTSLGSRIVADELTGDGLVDLVAQSASSGKTLFAYSGSGAAGREVAKFEFPADVDLQAAWLMAPGANPRFVAAGSDGAFRFLDAGLSAGASSVRFGGYYAAGAWLQLELSPVVGALGGSAHSVLAQDSRGSLHRIDAKESSLASSPKPVWTRPHATAGAIVAGLDSGSPGVVCRALKEPVADPAQHLVKALHADGSEIWSQPIESTPFNDLVPAELDGDSIPDFFVQWGSDSDVFVHSRAISGESGATLWDGPAIGPGPTRLPAGGASTDWNGDGVADFVFQAYGTRVLSGASGASLATGGPTAEYFMPIVQDLDGDAVGDFVYQGGFYPSQAWAHDLTTTLWASADDDRPFPYGAITSCPGDVPRLIEGSYANPARLKVTRLSGPQAGSFQTKVLAGGAMHADENGAKASGATLGQLTSTVVHSNLTNQGHPTALVGSSDGWLYAIDPCSLVVDFTFNFNASVGAIAFGDTDGDGNDELLVSVADGFLYDLKQPPVPAPTFVWDTDPDHGVTDADVDDVELAMRLSAKWGAVSGATSYQVAVTNAATSEFVSMPAWQDVGLETSTTVSDLPLKNGEKYLFAVRAMLDGLPSPDALSDGVTVHAPSDVDGGPDGGPQNDGGANGSGGASGEQEHLLSGRACTCAIPGSTEGPRSARQALVLGLLAAAGAIGRRRARVWRGGASC